MNCMRIDNLCFHITDQESGLHQVIAPKAVESCMHPGEFLVTPIVYEENEELIHISCENMEILLRQEDIKSGRVEMKKEIFTPKIIRKKNGCQPCTNCGRCSW